MSSGVYLVHFDEPLHHAKHYLGFSDDIARRIKCHRTGNTDARLMQVIAERGIGFTLVRVWPDRDRHFERRLKRRKNTPKLCPICNGQIEDLQFDLADVEPVAF